MFFVCAALAGVCAWVVGWPRRLHQNRPYALRGSSYARTEAALPPSGACMKVSSVVSIARSDDPSVALVALRSSCLHDGCMNRVIARSIARNVELFRLGEPGAELGTALCALDDLDGDGAQDFAVSTHGGGLSKYAKTLNGLSPIEEPKLLPGEVWICSGESGLPLWKIVGSTPGGGFGETLALLGDLDGDRVRELAIGVTMRGRSDLEPTNGHVLVYSVALRAPLHESRAEGVARALYSVPDFYGASIAAAPDLNGDGVVDYVVGAPGGGSWGRAGVGAAYLCSGRNGAVIREWRGTAELDNFAWTVFTADVDRDGRVDLICSTPGRRLDCFLGFGVKAGLSSDLSISGPGFTGLGASFARQFFSEGVSSMLIGSWEPVPDRDEFSVWRFSLEVGLTDAQEWSGNDEYALREINDWDGDGMADIVAYPSRSLVLRFWSSLKVDWMNVLIE